MVERDCTEQSPEELIQVSDEREHVGRVERLRMLLADMNPMDLDGFPCSALPLAYFEEARLCWCMGTYVATIVMSQLAIEELLRSHYRTFTRDIAKRRKLDNASFAYLINEAEAGGWLTLQEAADLHKTRSSYRNAYVHPHDYTDWATQDRDSDRTNFQKQTLKIYCPEAVGKDVIDEAYETVKLLVSLFPKKARRFWGLEGSLE